MAWPNFHLLPFQLGCIPPCSYRAPIAGPRLRREGEVGQRGTGTKAGRQRENWRFSWWSTRSHNQSPPNTLRRCSQSVRQANTSLETRPSITHHPSPITGKARKRRCKSSITRSYINRQINPSKQANSSRPGYRLHITLHRVHP